MAQLNFWSNPPSNNQLEYILNSTNSPLSDLGVSRLRIEPTFGAYSGVTEKNEELIFHILSGEAHIQLYGSWGRRTLAKIGGRKNIFKELSHTVIARPNTEFYVTAASRYLDVLIARCSGVRNSANLPTVLSPNDTQVHEIGEGHLRRTVREIVGGHSITERLRLGEKINAVGGWSSFPHHDHASDPARAPLFEEVFLYFANPSKGGGLQRRQGLFTDGTAVDDVLIVKSNYYALMPLGTHPLVSDPDSQVMYVWAYASDVPKKYAKYTEDLSNYA